MTASRPQTISAVWRRFLVRTLTGRSYLAVAPDVAPPVVDPVEFEPPPNELEPVVPSVVPERTVPAEVGDVADLSALPAASDFLGALSTAEPACTIEPASERTPAKAIATIFIFDFPVEYSFYIPSTGDLERVVARNWLAHVGLGLGRGGRHLRSPSLRLDAARVTPRAYPVRS
jgi:hypothetical protein